MPPKFQSSFIPKGPVSENVPSISLGRKPGSQGILSMLGTVAFTLSVLLAIGVFGYKFYLKYRIDKMSVDLENARAALEPETIRTLSRFDNRIVSTKELISQHRVLSPLFEFLAFSTPNTVRFNDFRYEISENGLELNMRGEARGYSALALQADIFNKSQYLKNPIFSDLNLNERGDVSFSFKATINPAFLAYEVSTPTATSTQN